MATGYGYDTAGRLWKVYANGSTTPTSTYTYDANGNRAGGTYDAQDRLTALGATTYTYGPNGELKTKADATGTTTYTYDAHGNLRRVVPPAPGATIDYVIDGQNRRVGKKLGGNLVNGWVYDGARVVAELDASGAVLSRFYYGANGHSPESMIRGGVSYRILTDQLGSPRLVVNASTGAVAQRLEYDAWGKVTSDTNAGFQPFGFAGGKYDRSTSLTRFGARDYDANSGRWTTKDGTRFDGGLNPYAYCNSEPVNTLDIDGFDPSGGGSAGGGGATDDWGPPSPPSPPGPGDEPSPCDDDPDIAAHKCTTKCDKVNVDGTGGGNCTGHVTGEGKAGTQNDACKAAKKDAGDKAAKDGCRKKHCQPCDCKKG